MSIRVPLIVSLLIVAAMAGLSAWAWPLVPDMARIAVHWGINGEANGFAGKREALTILPALALGMIVLLSAIPHVEPRRLNLASSTKLFRAAWIGGIVIVAIAHVGIVLGALHVAIDMPRFIFPAVALLFVVIGNYLGKTRSNFFAGIRTPWTLSSDYSWEKTHRLTGRLYALAGACSFVVSFAADATIAGSILLAGLLGATMIGILASYLYWRHDPARHAHDSVQE
jgi:uncharacterized membrane protein